MNMMQTNRNNNFSTQDMRNKFIIPKNTPRQGFYVSERFSKKLISHIVKNTLSQDCSVDIPLMMAVQGFQGDGKSSQIREICSKYNIYIYPISGSSLSGSHEKEALEVISDAYIEASNFLSSNKFFTIILIDDFDLSVASTTENREYTVNSQLLAGFLMNLADDPERCSGHQVCRIPIVLTGNNFSDIYAPLSRHGRMDFFTWNPDFVEKLEILKSLYQNDLSYRELGQLDRLLNPYKDEPISFFVALKSDFLDTTISECINRSKSLDPLKIRDLLQGNPFKNQINIRLIHKFTSVTVTGFQEI